MAPRTWLVLLLAWVFLVPFLMMPPAPACCPAPPSGKAVVNADQTVIILWDAATQTEHFIRKASFKSEADDFGFLVPTPSRPELDESGNDVFPYLQKVTEPETKKVPRPSGGMSCGCATKKSFVGETMAPAVTVLEEKLVAGFKAAVLQTNSAAALVGWLKDNSYAYSPEIEAWAKPYVENGWRITALKVAKTDTKKETVTASALRMSFKTDRPLFPYREPESKSAAAALGAEHRLLRIYFLTAGRFHGELAGGAAWTGKVAWANKLSDADRRKVLELLKLPETTGPANWWLTEFEDNWPYRTAPGDLTFTLSSYQDTVKRPPIIQYVASPWPADGMTYALAAVLVVPLLVRRLRRGQKRVSDPEAKHDA